MWLCVCSVYLACLSTGLQKVVAYTWAAASRRRRRRRRRRSSQRNREPGKIIIIILLLTKCSTTAAEWFLVEEEPVKDGGGVAWLYSSQVKVKVKELESLRRRRNEWKMKPTVWNRNSFSYNKIHRVCVTFAQRRLVVVQTLRWEMRSCAYICSVMSSASPELKGTFETERERERSTEPFQNTHTFWV